MGDGEVSLSLVVVTGCVTLVLASALAYVLLNKSQTKNDNAAATTKAKASSPALDKTKYPGGQLSVYYATQTGTAESFARQLEREGAEMGFYMHVVDLEDVQVEQMMHAELASRAVILTATYGEGECPDNATNFVDALCEMAGTEILYQQSPDGEIMEPTALKGLDYCVFGLANKQYDHFNAMGKFFNHALERVGATRILELGEGDDDDDLESDFETWKDTKFWPTMKKLYLANVDVAASSSKKKKSAPVPESQYTIEYHDKKSASASRKEKDHGPIHASSRHYFTAVDCPVKVIRELRTKEDPGSTVHMEIDISKSPELMSNYQTADNLGVLPLNDASIVESVAQSLGYDLDQVFSLQAAPNHEWHGTPFPMPITVRECLTRYCDLTSAPRRSDLKLLSAYAKDPTDQKALLRMASKEGRAEYREKIVDEYMGLVNLFKLCPSIAMPLEHFLTVCPLMQTRFFTISSSSSVHPKMIHLTVAVTNAKRSDGSTFEGVCSNYLAHRVNKGGKTTAGTVRVFLRPSTFRLPQDASRPIVMIGPGTGVAPMRALLQEREHQQKKKKQSVGANILYFGCKKQSQDYLYKQELEAFQKNGVLNKLRLAFSRQTSEKIYVQHLLKQDGDDMWNLIDRDGAYIYVCGGVKMGQDVAETLKSIISSHGSLDHDKAKEYLAKMSSEGRFVQELWA